MALLFILYTISLILTLNVLFKASLNAITPEGGEEKKEGESVNGNQNGVVPME